MNPWLGLVLVLFFAVWGLAYRRMPLWFNTASVAAVLVVFTWVAEVSVLALLLLWLVFLAVFVPLNVFPLRRRLISAWVFELYRNVLPSMSQTEREALEAGDVGWDAELFSGRPDWRKLLALPEPALSDEEKAFLAGPVEELCQRLDDWHIHHERYDLPPAVWDFIKQKGFFGMIIPKAYGGLGFSALAHSAVVMKIASRSVSAAVTVMVPNSLGPGQLLLHYGTEQQKDYYLPRLARGQEIPCFALTGPEAGSDASAMPDTGIVCRGQFQGEKDVLGIRLNWDKRYITLAPIATLLGLAFKLDDPEQLLGGEKTIGITLALVPTGTPGVSVGRRHYPANLVFQNGPTQGKDVFIPIDWIIGGVARAGQGWRMLMECLADGRGISLPALSTAAGKLAARVTGAYARVRKQFRVPIGEFEGVEEVLARIGGSTYLMDAARVMTLGFLDQGMRPSVVTAIIKYHLTEMMRQVINDAMDVHGGKGIMMGPRNYLARTYQALPISITVEGANILTRSMIIFGQGAIRSHPFILREMQAVTDPDRTQGETAFDRALFGHIGFIGSNQARAFWLGLTGARFVKSATSSPSASYFRQLDRMSAAFALIADATMLILGGELKRREKLSARLGDVLSHLCLASAVLKHFEDQGHRQEDTVLMKWACQTSLYAIQEGLDGLLNNFPYRLIATMLRMLVFPFGKPYRMPDDALGYAVARLLLSPSAARDRLTQGVFIPQEPSEPVAQLEDALVKVVAADPIERKLDKAMHSGRLSASILEDAIDEALVDGIIDLHEASIVRDALQARRQVVRVDDFAADGLGMEEPRWQSERENLRAEPSM
ncbi:MAG: acyl-CoA dehydrogenase [Gammaproteobacteria bacterium]|nr:acyl-CoA dehydrogenase [Gammaproteobacteria bacterium]MCI0591025.1 acyl-CoA dehydrogenase [Gammaproteobacteria bacterium]